MTLWLVGAPPPSPPVAPPLAAAGEEDSPTRVHELYTAACGECGAHGDMSHEGCSFPSLTRDATECDCISGTYLCWLAARAITLLRSWLPQGRAAILARIKQWCIWGAKSAVAFSVLLGVIPLMFGLLLELVVVVPLRVPLDQTPVLFVWQDWALGERLCKLQGRLE